MIQATRKLGLHEPIPSSALIWQRLWWSDFLHCLALQLFVEALPKECVVCEPRCGHVPVLECLVLICQPSLRLSTHFQYSKIGENGGRGFSSVCSPEFIALWSAGALSYMKNICSFSSIDVALIQGFVEALSVDAILVGLYDAPDHLLVKQRDIW